MLFRQIIHLATIFGEIVKLPFQFVRHPLAINRLPVALANRVGGLMVKANHSFGQRLTFECGQQTLAFHWRDRLAIEFRRILRPSHVHQRGQNVHHVCWITHPLIRLSNSLRPVSNERSANTAFVGEVFVEPIRGVAQIRPRTAVRLMGAALTDLSKVIARS